jgi:hypothetical protein
MITVSSENVSKSAAALIRANFNPSGMGEVDEIKQLAARLITLMEPYAMRSETERHAMLAIDAIEAGAMWAVKAATTGK